MQNKNVTVVYALSEDGRKDSILKGGDGKQIQTFQMPLSKEILKYSNCNDSGELYLFIKPIKYEISTTFGSVKNSGVMLNGYMRNHDAIRKCGFDNYSYSISIFDFVQTPDSILNLIKSQEDEFDTLEKQLPAALEQYKEKCRIENERCEKERADRAERDEANRLEKTRIEEEKKVETKKYNQERIEWTKIYGSQYLKDCLELNCTANLEYIVERAAVEFPGYVVDYIDNSDWEKRLSPSVEALTELKRIRNEFPYFDSKIVWLIKPALEKQVEEDFDNYYDSPYPREAVVITNYLNKYTIIQEI